MTTSVNETSTSKDAYTDMFAHLAVTDIAIASLAKRSGLSNGVIKDLDVLIERLPTHEDMQSENTSQLRDAMLRHAKQMKELFALEEGKSSLSSA